jgi:carbon-monoxide dehydrogenase medium subunit
MNWTGYRRAGDAPEALDFLEEAGGKGRLIAGGTDLLLQLRRGERHAELLVDITAIEELKGIAEGDGWIRIGAGVTHGEVAKHPVIRKEAAVLSEGCGHMGSPQIRNMGTLGGNIVSAQPAADGAVALMALESEIKVVSKGSERWMALEDAYRDIGVSAVDPSREIVTEIRFRKPGKHGLTGFFRMARRKALILPSLNGAVVLVFDAALGRVERARIALGPVAKRPYRARTAEACLESGMLSAELIAEAARIAAEEAEPRTSPLRGSGAYRKEMVRLYLGRTIAGIVEGMTVEGMKKERPQ